MSRSSTTAPSTVVSQAAEIDRAVNWVKQAWTEIQNRYPDWRWMRSTFSVNTPSGDDTYAGTDCTDTRLSAAVSRFSRWWPHDEDGHDNVTFYLTATGVSAEAYLIFLPWSVFRDRYKKGTQTNAPPIHFTIDPQNNLVLGPKPDAIYTVLGEYQRSAQTLSADADEPECPSRFHSVIWLEGLKKYAAYKNAPEAMSRGISDGNKVMRQLEADQRPEMKTGRPLA